MTAGPPTGRNEHDPPARIELVPHTPRWAEDFERARLALADALGGDILAIEHIGSTAIPGIVAKPIIDIAVAVTSFEEGAGCIARIEALGYRYRGENGIPRRHYFVRGNPVDLHLHMFEAAGDHWRRHIAFRDHLRRSPEVAGEYSRLKLALAAECGDDRAAYTDRKGPFITTVTDRAIAEQRHADIAGNPVAIGPPPHP